MKWKTEVYIIIAAIFIFDAAWILIHNSISDDLDLAGEIAAYVILFAFAIAVVAYVLIEDKKFKQGLRK